MSSTLRIKGPAQVKGELEVPGDKSLSHRVAMMGAVADGVTTVTGFSSSADCLSTLACLSRLGIRVEMTGDRVMIYGRGLDGFRPSGEPARLDAGNSGSTIRMLSGLLAAQPFTSMIDGDDSLRRRPMRRIIEPMQLMGARVEAADSNFPPLKIHGAKLKPIIYESPVASAQVKTCVLLAGLCASGRTVFREPSRSRNHTEVMLREFGASVDADDSSCSVAVEGGRQLRPLDYHVPGDVSSAAFFIAAATVLPDSELLLRDICLNPSRTAFLDVLKALGARVEEIGASERHGERVGDLLISTGELRTGRGGLVLSGGVIPNLIDEAPILAVLATQAEGRVEVRDARELRIKESDRIRTIVDGIRALGGQIEEFDDGFAVTGPQRLRAGRVETAGDHRIAMSMSVAALVAEGTTEIVDADCAKVSFPEFFDFLARVAGQNIFE